MGALLGIYWEGSLYDELDPKLRFENTLFALKDFFKGLSLISPILILLEDLHWIDDDSQKALQTLTRNIDAFPIVVIASSRFNDDGSKPVLKVDEEVTQKEISITALTHNSTVELINYQLQYISDESLTRFIEDKTEGNPFFTQQFCLYLVENNLLELKKNKYILKKSDIEIPSRISDIIIARIDRLSKELKDAVQIASVLGREFEVKVLQSLINLYRSAIKDEKFKSLLETGEDEQVWNTLTELKYIFKHALLQETVYEMQLKQRLRELHKLAGETIESIYKDDETFYSELAYHYENAEEFEKAKKYLQKVGNLYRQSQRKKQALHYYEKGLEICKKYVGENHTFYADALNNVALVLDDTTTKIAYHERTLKIYKENGLEENHEYMSTVLNNIGLAYYEDNKFNKAFSYYKKALKIRREKKQYNHPKTAQIYNNIGLVYLKTKHYEKAIRYFRKAMKIWNNFDESRNISIAYLNLGLAFYRIEKYNMAFENYSKSLTINLSFKDKNKLQISTLYNNIGDVYHKNKEYDKAIECHNKSKDLIEELYGKEHEYYQDSVKKIKNILSEMKVVN